MSFQLTNTEVKDVTSSNPKWLYHYTSIDVFALILNDPKIRFRRLDLMDDPNEALTSDLGRQGKYVMASCCSGRSSGPPQSVANHAL